MENVVKQFYCQDGFLPNFQSMDLCTELTFVWGFGVCIMIQSKGIITQN